MKKILFVLCLLVLPTMLIASNLRRINGCNHHVAICFDQCLPEGYKNLLRNNFGISEFLKKIITNKNLLHEGDYYSILTYKEGSLDCTMKNYAQPAQRDGKQLLWQQYSNINEMLAGNWQDVACGHSEVKGEPFSLQTAAKPYCLGRLCRKDMHANRTFLLMVTDDAYNGNGDLNTEFNKMGDIDVSLADRTLFEKLKANYLSYCRKVACFYRFDYMGEYLIDTRYKDHYKILLFEVVPTSSFSLASVVEYPANLGLKRVRGGYQLDFNYRSIDATYSINRFLVTTKDNEGNIKTIYDEKGDGHVDVCLNTDELPSDSLEVSISGWLLQNDGVYNGVEMSPDDDNFSRQSTSYKLALQPSNRILGIFPLYDSMWWWYPDDLNAAVNIWNIIFVLMFVLIIYMLIRIFIKYNAVYEPANKDITLEKI